jgi:hypothetical protein
MFSRTTFAMNVPVVSVLGVGMSIMAVTYFCMAMIAMVVIVLGFIRLKKDQW